MITNDTFIKRKCEKSFLFFARYIFKEKYLVNFIIAPHLILISQALMKVITGETKRLIIKCAP